ncbi:MAG: Methyltransferase [Parcubacteria group bacterium GW2011_GWB1_40_14]|nr:MAG: Methyltransferase [Parcubacteria group bacterium GW2011_GWB1_40_14]
MDYSSINKKTYDNLAQEYEERVESLMPVTKAAMDYFASYIKPKGRVLDIGCAVGIAVSVLTEKGFEVCGIDISESMTGFAKKRNPNSKIITGDFLETEFEEKFDAVLAFAFIHLFPKKEVLRIIDKISAVLNSGGVALLSSTESEESKEGWYVKDDFNKKEKRFRKFWTEEELRATIQQAGFEVIDLKKFPDPFGKTWMDFIARKI